MNYHYYNRYIRLIEFRKNNKPLEGENHHIIPKCLGGMDDEYNMVFLTYREHYIAHYLLAKSYDDEPKLWYAFNMMKRISGGKSILYEMSRKYIVNNLKNDVKRAKKISLTLTGKQKSLEHRKKLSESRIGRKTGPHKKETIEKMKKNGIRDRKCYHNKETGEYRYFKNNEIIPNEFVIGAGPNFIENVKNRKKRMCWYHDPDTKDNIRLGENEIAPKNYIRGRHVDKIECCGKLYDPGNLGKHRRSDKCLKI